jgi:hypothetical protein
VSPLAQRERLLVGSDGDGVPAKMVVGDAKAVPGCRLTAAVAEFLVQPECLLAVLQGRLVVAQPGMARAELVERVGLPDSMAAGLEPGEGLLGLV